MDNILGMRIKELRKNSRISQAYLANVLHVSSSTMSQYESGQRNPSDQIKRRIADYFNVSLDYLLGRKNETKPSAADTANGIYTIEINVGKRSITPQEIEDLRYALSVVDDKTVRSIIHLIKAGSE